MSSKQISGATLSFGFGSSKTPTSVPARAPVDVHRAHLDLAHSSRAAHAAPLALLSLARLGDHRVEAVRKAVPHPRQLGDLARVEPRAGTAEAPVDLDAVELEDDQGFLADGAHGQSII